MRITITLSDQEDETCSVEVHAEPTTNNGSDSAAYDLLKLFLFTLDEANGESDSVHVYQGRTLN